MIYLFMYVMRNTLRFGPPAHYHPDISNSTLRLGDADCRHVLSFHTHPSPSTQFRSFEVRRMCPSTPYQYEGHIASVLILESGFEMTVGFYPMQGRNLEEQFV